MYKKKKKNWVGIVQQEATKHYRQQRLITTTRRYATQTKKQIIWRTKTEELGDDGGELSLLRSRGRRWRRSLGLVGPKMLGRQRWRRWRWTGGRAWMLFRVHILVQVVGPIVLGHPVADIGLAAVRSTATSGSAAVGHHQLPVSRVPEPKHLVRGGHCIELALLRHLPFFAHDPVQVSQESRAGRRQKLGWRRRHFVYQVIVIVMVDQQFGGRGWQRL